jgi:hypothetical protein
MMSKAHWATRLVHGYSMGVMRGYLCATDRLNSKDSGSRYCHVFSVFLLFVAWLSSDPPTLERLGTWNLPAAPMPRAGFRPLPQVLLAVPIPRDMELE